jgi:hypothetical protein
MPKTSNIALSHPTGPQPSLPQRHQTTRVDDSRYEEWLASLTIHRDEAFLPGEPIPHLIRRRYSKPQKKADATAASPSRLAP